MKKYINEIMIRHWIGSDHDNKEACLGLLVELLNDIYDVQEMRDDILALWCEDDEEVV
jgi:hypothetical protein